MCSIVNVLSIFCVILTLNICTVDNARILGIFHIPSYSHYQLGSTIMKELARRGHNVTVINPFPQKKPVKNFTDVALTGLVKHIEANRKQIIENQIDANPFLADLSLHYQLSLSTEGIITTDNVQSLLRSNETFDLVIIEELGRHALKGFAYHYNAPCVIFSSSGPSRWINHQVANPSIPSYIPDISLPYAGKMTFFERLHNTNVILHKYFPGAPDVKDLHYNVSLALVNAHVSTHHPVPYVPNMIDVGGLHISPPKQLPADIKEFLDNAKEGVVLFSMGSGLISSDVTVEKRNAVRNAFAQLKEKVLWKWDEDLPELPENIKIKRWIPQSDILAHPNVKLFITHGGLLGTTETIHHGVPVVGIPRYADQKINLRTAVDRGIGLMVPYSELTESNFLSAIQEVLINKKYRENAKRISKILQDQPMKPLDRAIFWIEYVLRHGGAPHLRTAALNLSWYQYILLDVFAFIFAVILTIGAILYIIIKKCITRKSKSQKITKKSKVQ